MIMILTLIKMNKCLCDLSVLRGLDPGGEYHRGVDRHRECVQLRSMAQSG